MNPFRDPEAVARYAEGPPRIVPGLADLRRMTRILLAENAPDDARVLVVGAGGGLELKVFADAQPNWRFDGVDPAPEMLRLAEQTLGPLARRVAFHEGYVDTAPEGPFDAASCLFTLHFVAIPDRLPMLAEIRRRLKPGAPFVVAHLSIPEPAAGRALWLSRYVAFAVESGVERFNAEQASETIASTLPIMSPEAEEATLRAAGFSRASLFYAGLAFRGWVAYA